MNSILFTVPTNLLTTYNVQLKLPFINEKKNIDALYIKECAVSQDSIIFTFINSNDSKDSKLLFKSTSKIKFENTFFVIDVLDSTSVKFTKTFLNFLVSSGEVLTFSEYSPENATITFQFSSLIENYGHLFSNITHSSDLFFGVFTPASSNPKIINMSLQILLKFQIKTKEDVSQ
jgi:hypothetical protein